MANKGSQYDESAALYDFHIIVSDETIETGDKAYISSGTTLSVDELTVDGELWVDGSLYVFESLTMNGDIHGGGQIHLVS